MKQLSIKLSEFEQQDLNEMCDTITTVLKKYNINHFGKCDVSKNLPCSCGRNEIIEKLKNISKRNDHSDEP